MVRSLIGCVVVLGLGLASGCGAPPRDCADCSEIRSGLVIDTASVFGFERLDAWQVHGATVTLDSTVSQGAHSFALTGLSYATLTSVPVNVTTPFPATIGVDLMIPSPQPNPFWFGAVQLFVSCPSRGVNNAYIGQRDLLPFPTRAFATAGFAVPPSLQASLPSCSALTFTVAINVPANGGTYRVDNLRFNPVITPPTADILGFESVNYWSATSGTIATNAIRTQGAAALAVSGFSYTELRSAPVGSVAEDNASQIGYDLLLPTQQPNPFWFGSTALYVTIPSAGIATTLLGQLELTGKPLGQFFEVAFSLPPAIATALASHADGWFKIVLNVAQGTGIYRLDNLRLSPNRGACLQPDPLNLSAVPMFWHTYDTGSPAGREVPGATLETVSGSGQIGGTSDGFRFQLQSTGGELDAALRINFISRTAGATGGLMLRQSLTPDSAYVYLGATSAGLTLRSRSAQGAASVTQAVGAFSNDNPGGTHPVSVRLANTSNGIAAYTSPDGVTWKRVGTVALSLGPVYEIGIATAGGGNAPVPQGAASYTGFDVHFANGCGRCN